MSKQTIFIGNTANDRTGDPLRTAFQKVNDNFDELYSLAGADVQIPVQTGNGGKILTTNGTTLSWTPNNRIVNGNITISLNDQGALVFPAGSKHYDLGAGDGILSHNINVNNNIWSFNFDGNLDLPSGTGTTSGAIQQRTTRTVTQGNTNIEAGSSGTVFSAAAWQTGFKLVIIVETRLDDNTNDVDHTQMCEAMVASNYNADVEPTMSVYGLTYTSPAPLATFSVQKSGYIGSGSGTVEVIATNTQSQYNLFVSVHAVQFGSAYD